MVFVVEKRKNKGGGVGCGDQDIQTVDEYLYFNLF